MKITCNLQPLVEAYQTAASIAPSRSPRSILQNVKLVAKDEATTVLASDTEVGVRLSVSGVTVESPGSVVLPVARFGPILRESTDESFQIESDGSALYVRGERSEFRLQIENADEYPDVPEFEESAYQEIPARLVRELVRRTLFATDTESSRYALGGVLMEFSPESAVAVGTDGRRLAKMEGICKSIAGHADHGKSIIVPTKAMGIMDRALSDSDPEIKIAARSNDVILKSERLTLYSRLVEGRFPKWQEIIRPRDNVTQVELAVGPLYSAVRQAAIVACKETRGVDFCFDDGKLTLAAISADVGDSRIEIPISYDGERIELSLDHRYVSEFLKVLDLDKTITLSIDTQDGPAQFDTDDGYTYVIMPMARDAARKAS